jgi:2'-5' RNA ligase
MNKKAIDVVLLPSQKIMDTAIAINQELLQRGEPKKMVLNKSDCLPHISILMGCVADTALPVISRLLSEIAAKFTAFHLQITEIQQEGSSTVLNVLKDTRLQQLHEIVAKQFQPFLTYDAVAEMLYHPAEARQNSIDYINNFLINASYSKYSPHITVGSGAYQTSGLPIPFVAATLAICHLGNYCTCRKILYQVELASGG